MIKHNCKKIVFSSSCTVYGNNPNAPFTEDTAKATCESPYGWTKSVLEDLLYGLYQSS
jgi:UDP-glucose 4-epimerase